MFDPTRYGAVKVDMKEKIVPQTAVSGPETNVVAVVIGRNEGARLVACLASLRDQVGSIVYVDSGSTDGSVTAAQAAGATVVELDMTLPFTAARARNAGLAVAADATFVQFVDGDCDVRADWVATAVQFLQDRADVAVVCGRRRELAPEASVYNRLCDQEWDTPIGQTLACGGDALMRVDAVIAAGGYRETLIAGEEPDLCLRLRQAGWVIWRLDAEMTLHDAHILHFAQWWQRSRRAGHAFAEGAYLHGRPPDRHWVAETRRALLWGAAVPLAALAVPWILLVYPIQIFRLSRKLGSWTQAVFSVLGKTPEAFGVIAFHVNRLRGRRTRLMEYK